MGAEVGMDAGVRRALGALALDTHRQGAHPTLGSLTRGERLHRHDAAGAIVVVIRDIALVGHDNLHASSSSSSQSSWSQSSCTRWMAGGDMRISCTDLVEMSPWAWPDRSAEKSMLPTLHVESDTTPEIVR